MSFRNRLMIFFLTILLAGTGPVPITEADITQLAESLWTLDVNRLSPVNDYVINKQAQVGDGDDVDSSPDPWVSMFIISLPQFNLFYFQ